MSRLYASLGKRIVDVIAAAVALLVASPLLACVALLVRWQLGSPVLFRQTRPGKQGRAFELLKFRTMTDIRDTTGALCPDAERLGRFGRVLRSTSLDELPELWNVLRGEMSLVGPRPLLMEYLPLYSEFQTRRHEVLPGITGWAQINGRNAASWQDRLAMDVWYVDNISLALDLRILLRTLGTVWSREGIAHPGHVTVERFRGHDESRDARGGRSSEG